MQEFINMRNPILPPEYHVPDAEAHVMPDGQLYLYGSYDIFDGMYCSGEYHVVSTPDLEHWTVHDTSLHGDAIEWFGRDDTPKYPETTQRGVSPFIRKTYIRSMFKKSIRRLMRRGNPAGEDAYTDSDSSKMSPNPALLYAPDCIEKGGRYFLYFCMSDDSEGVAVSAHPEGPFTDPVLLPCSGIDPAVFIDDDGQAYYYWGQFSSYGVKLNDDMISFDRTGMKELLTEKGHYFHEGSSVRRIGDTYYYVFADMQRGKPTSLGYATGPSPLGPFTYRGIIIDNDGCDPESWNNHGSIERFNGQWYVFYHRCSRGGREHRRLCIEPITIASDGSIAEVPMTSQGVGAPFASGEAIPGWRACGLKGSVFIGTDESSYEETLQNISDKDEAVFRYVESSDAYRCADIVCRGSGTVEILMDGRKAGTIRCFDETNGRYHTVSGEMSCAPGRYTLTLRFRHTRDFRVAAVILYCHN